jgi:hypothetical protein
MCEKYLVVKFSSNFFFTKPLLDLVSASIPTYALTNERIVENVDFGADAGDFEFTVNLKALSEEGSVLID